MARNKGNDPDETKQVQDSNVVMIDRISKLPDSVILYILALLPTVEVIRTSLISKRWRQLWNSVPALEFFDAGIEEQEQKFYNFVNNCLDHRMIGIDEADSILVEAVNLRSFLLDTHGGDCNLNLISCKNLKNLTLNSFHRIPNVEDAISELLILESLTVFNCEIPIIQYQYLKVLVLKRTIIEDDVYEWDDTMEITVDTPNLVSFHYEDVNCTRKVLLNSPNLEEANISLDYIRGRRKIDMNWYVDMIDFLSHFDCAKVVSLYVYSEEYLMFPEKLRKFCRSPLPNVKHLKVETGCELKSESLLRDALLWLSPHTETLSIRSEENKARS